MCKGNREEEFDWFVIMRGSFGFVLRLTGDHTYSSTGRRNRKSERFYRGSFSYISYAVVVHPPNRKINCHLFQHPLSESTAAQLLLVSTTPRLYYAVHIDYLLLGSPKSLG